MLAPIQRMIAMPLNGNQVHQVNVEYCQYNK